MQEKLQSSKQGFKMHRKLKIVIVMAVFMALLAAQSQAKDNNKKRGGRARVKFSSGGYKHKRHNFKFHNQKKFVHKKHSRGNHPHFHARKHNHRWHNSYPRWKFNARYMKSVHWGHGFPYKVAWNHGQYWVYYDGVWMPYEYLIQNHAGAWQWHQQHFHQLKLQH